MDTKAAVEKVEARLAGEMSVLHEDLQELGATGDPASVAAKWLAAPAPTNRSRMVPGPAPNASRIPALQQELAEIDAAAMEAYRAVREAVCAEDYDDAVEDAAAESSAQKVAATNLLENPKADLASVPPAKQSQALLKRVTAFSSEPGAWSWPAAQPAEGTGLPPAAAPKMAPVPHAAKEAALPAA